MQSLFNHYGAMNMSGQDMSDEFRRELRRFIDKHKDGNSLNEMECILVGTLTGLFAEERIDRGMKIKREERVNAK